jgi:hypothetical protein
MHHALAELGTRCEFIVDVKCVVISGEARESGHVFRRDRAGKAFGLTNCQIQKSVCSAGSHCWRSGRLCCL